jgi:ubiquinone/menaquinone biosynthesis C-methylase UbiE
MNTLPLTPEPLLSRLESLADPIRLRLLMLLEQNELSVSDLAGILQTPQSSVSRHLKPLAEQGWIVSRSERTANLYRMANGELPEAARQLWELSRQEITGWAQLAHDRLRLDQRLAERQPDARALFAGMAGEWERLRSELYGDRFTEAALTALLPPCWVVADLACGAGSVTVRLAPFVARVLAVDRTPEMLDAARTRARDFSNVEFHEADLGDLPIAGGTCDAALILLALTHLENPAAALAEMARILRPGGRAVVVDLLHHDRDDFRRQMGQLRNGFRAAELAQLLTAAGLTAVTCSPLSPEPDAKGPALLLATGTLPDSKTDPKTDSMERKTS